MISFGSGRRGEGEGAGADAGGWRPRWAARWPSRTTPDPLARPLGQNPPGNSVFCSESLQLIRCGPPTLWKANPIKPCVLALHSFNDLALCCSMQDLVPGPGIEPRAPELGARSLNRWTTLFLFLNTVPSLSEWKISLEQRCPVEMFSKILGMFSKHFFF